MLGEVLERARSAAAGPVGVLVNPEMLNRHLGGKKEREVCRILQAAAADGAPRGKKRAGVRITLFWNSRNASYLLRSLGGTGASRVKADLILQFGPELDFHAAAQTAAAEVKTIRWAWRPNGEDLFIPLDRSIWLSGYSEPSGRSPRRAGVPSQQALKNLIIQ